ncbi:MAG: hypothetical protein D6714_12755, partial [Bacteroidetes bacterium]
MFALSCNKTTTPAGDSPVIEDPGNNGGPSEDLPDYVVLDGFIGRWHQSTIPTSDGNVLIVGNEREDGHDRMILTKTNTAGEVLFSTLFHQEDSKAMAVCEDSAENIYVVGSAFQAGGNEDRIMAAAKLDKNGNVLWEQVYHPETPVSGLGIAVWDDNEIIVCGSTEDQFDLAFLKIDSLGAEKAFKIIPSPGEYRTPSGMLLLHDGNILITDYEGNRFNLTWYDPQFNLLREKSYGGNSRVCRSAIQLNDGSIVAVGSQTHLRAGSNAIDSSKVLIMKTDAEGTLLWEKEAGDAEFLNDGQSIAVNQDGSFVINGYALSDNLNNTDHMIIYVDEEGNEINAKYFTDDKTFRGANILKVE